MVNVSIDVTDLGGEARPGDKVVFWRPRMGGSATHAGRVISTAPVTVFLTDGKATVSDVEPGEMTVLLQCRGVESQGPVTVGVPDGKGTVTLRALLESQFEYAPPIVSAVQEAASNASASEEAAIRAQVRSEAAADRADAKVDDAINNGANLIRAEVKQDADRAVSARQAATQAESNAAASEDAAAQSETNAAASESAAKQSETNAGDYAAVATTAATEAVDAMERATEIAGGDFATREYVDGTLESLEPRLLGDVSTRDIAFAVVDEKNRRTWLEVAEDGGPTEYALSKIGSGGGGSASKTLDFPTPDWAHWGDSNTDDYYLKSESWITKLSNLTGKNHYYGGFYNQKSINIAARQGGAPSLVTVANNKTAETGATEIVSAVNPVTSISPIYQVPGTLAGVHGRIKPLPESKQEFIPTTPGVYDIPPRSMFIPDAAAMRDRHVTIWMGRNDRYDADAPQQVLRSARHMVDFLTPHVKRFFVLQLVPGTEGLEHPRIKPINDLLKAEFQSQFIPIAEWMMTNRAAELAGITYTEQDQTDIAEGRIPTSFRSDGAHFNGVGCTAIAHFLHEEILKRGWL